MSGFDQYQEMQRLISEGWEEVQAQDGYYMRATSAHIDRLVAALRAQVGGSLHVYDARDVQDMLFPSPREDEAPNVPHEWQAR